jgi:hypothetical protein
MDAVYLGLLAVLYFLTLCLVFAIKRMNRQ